MGCSAGATAAAPPASFQLRRRCLRPHDRCLGLLLGTEPGRQLLQQSGLLSAALPPLQERSAEAAEAALQAVATAAAAPPAAPANAGRKKGAAAAAGAASTAAAAEEQALAACCAAAEAAALCGRVAVHLAGLTLLHMLVQAPAANEDDATAATRAASEATRAAAAAGLAQAVADCSSALATAADWLHARGGAAPAGALPPPLGGMARRLAGGAAAVLALLGDALRMGLLELRLDEREQLAGCGRSALGLLLALQPCAAEGPAEGAWLRA